MSELKKMTYRGATALLYPLGLEINLHGRLFYKEGEGININHIPVFIKDLGIELIPEVPEVKQENLCKFYLKFKDSAGRYPLGTFSNPCEGNLSKSERRGNAPLFFILNSARYLDHDGNFWHDFEITDPRWPEIAEEV